jgi:hypothetical protein
MDSTVWLLRAAVGNLVIAGLLVSGCTAQPPADGVKPAASTSAPAGPASTAALSGVVVSGEITAAGARVSAGSPIPSGVEVHAAGAAEVKLGNTAVSIKKGTRLSLVANGIGLSAGAVRIENDVDKVVVTAGDLTVTPSGTAFAVARSASGPSVVVSAGAVDVTGAGDGPLRMIAGEALAVGPKAVTLSATAPKDPFLAPHGQPAAGTGESSLRALRLAGTFLISMVIQESNTPDAKPGLKFKRLWKFTPRCAAGACDVAIKRPLLPFTCPSADGCGERATYNTGSLPYTDGTYAGNLSKGKTSCGSVSGGSRTTKGTFTVAGASLSGGGWVVTGIHGQIDDRSSSYATCGAFHLVTGITGQPA